MLSANYDPQSSPDAKPTAASTPPNSSGFSGGGGLKDSGNGNGNHFPTHSSAANTMFPFGALHQTAAAAPGMPAGLEQKKPTSRLDELFQSKSSQVGLSSLSVPPPPPRRFDPEGEEEEDQEIKVEDDDDDNEESGGVLDKSNGGSSSLDRLREICNKSIVIQPAAAGGSGGGGIGLLDRSIGSDTNDSNGSTNGNNVYSCHLCSYTSLQRDEFNAHVNEHYVFTCCKCEFQTKVEGEYRAHLRAEHDITPEELEDEQGVRVPKINSQGKMKSFRCKQCEYSTVTKEDFWNHTRVHIKPEKMLCCPKCNFVTEYKHHLEYHLRNHFGTKPFKCTDCSYTCVNKSMLNSHMKSHTNVYQYRCQDCTYATKYCHSLKLHLRKYGHKPAMVLNPDGTPNPLPIIDVYGTRRGPKLKKNDAGNKLIVTSNKAAANVAASCSMTPPTPPMIPISSPSRLLGPISPASPSSAAFPMLPSYVMAQMQHIHRMATGVNSPVPTAFPPPPPLHPLANSPLFPTLPTTPDASQMLKCRICHFETINPEVLKNHMTYHGDSKEDSHSPTTVKSEPSVEEEEVDEEMKEGDEEVDVGGSVRRTETSSANRNGRAADKGGEMSDYLTYLRKFAPLMQQQKQQQQPMTMGGSKGSASSQQSSQESPDRVSPSTSTANESTPPPPPPPPQPQNILSRLYLENVMKNLRKDRQESGGSGGARPVAAAATATSATTTTDDSDDSCALDLSNGQIDAAASSAAVASAVAAGSNPVPATVATAMPASAAVAAAVTTASSANGKSSRRKGKAFKLQLKANSAANSADEQSSTTDSLETGSNGNGEKGPLSGSHVCQHCELAFMDQIMYSIHMGYHGYQNPFKCNMCGDELTDKVSFFLHVARKSHQ